MKNLEIRHLKRKAEIAEEYNTVLQAAILFKKEGINMTKPVSHYEKKLKDYLSSFPEEYMIEKNINRLNNIRKVLSPLSKSSAESLVKSISLHLLTIPNFSQIELINYNKQGLKQGVNQKSDIRIKFFDNVGNLVATKDFSLKQYEQYSNPQVVSGTYLSTIAGLGFEPEGRGSFRRPDGKTFASKNHSQLKESFQKYYGEATVAIIDEILNITKDTHKLRKIPRRPTNLDQIRKKIGNSAVQPFISLIKIIRDTDPVAFKDRFLGRSGMKVSTKKEMIYSALKSGKPVTFNTLLDEGFSSFLIKLNQSSVDTEIIRSGKEKDGQGVSIVLRNNGKYVTSADIPLTININGAWANEDRWCKKSKMNIKKDHIRPGKASELDTSTNCYVKLKNQVFNPILKQRSKK